MNSSIKFLAIATVFLGVAQVIFAICPSAPQPTTTYCTGPVPATTADWDSCTAAGQFKSISYCYLSSRGYVLRYDWYTCTKTATGYTLTKGCCTNQPQTEYENPKGFTDVFNFYNEDTKKCDLVAPTAAPGTTAAATSPGASGATSTAAVTTTTLAP